MYSDCTQIFGSFIYMGVLPVVHYASDFCQFLFLKNDLTKFSRKN